MQEFPYDAFLSYAHSDLQSVERLHAFLENDWVKGQRKRIVYIDRERLFPGPMESAIDKALAESRYLIVCCSEAAAGSKWVNLEIEKFLEARSARLESEGSDEGASEYVIGCMVGPKGAVRSPVPEAFQRLEAASEELKLADLRHDLKRTRSAKKDWQLEARGLIAPLLGLKSEELLAKQARTRRYRRRIIATVASVMIAAAVAWWWWIQTDKYQQEQIRKSAPGLFADAESSACVDWARAMLRAGRKSELLASFGMYKDVRAKMAEATALALAGSGAFGDALRVLGPSLSARQLIHGFWNELQRRGVAEGVSVTAALDDLAAKALGERAITLRVLALGAQANLLASAGDQKKAQAEAEKALAIAQTLPRGEARTIAEAEAAWGLIAAGKHNLGLEALNSPGVTLQAFRYRILIYAVRGLQDEALRAIEPIKVRDDLKIALRIDVATALLQAGRRTESHAVIRSLLHRALTTGHNVDATLLRLLAESGDTQEVSFLMGNAYAQDRAIGRELMRITSVAQPKDLEYYNWNGMPWNERFRARSKIVRWTAERVGLEPARPLALNLLQDLKQGTNPSRDRADRPPAVLLDVAAALASVEERAQASKLVEEVLRSFEGRRILTPDSTLLVQTASVLTRLHKFKLARQTAQRSLPSDRLAAYAILLAAMAPGIDNPIPWYRTKSIWN
jgi:hypothetical protein